MTDSDTTRHLIPSSSGRSAWFLGRGSLTPAQRLGPAVRLLEMARRASDAGLCTTIAMDHVQLDEEGISTAHLDRRILPRIRPGDALVVSPHLPWPVLFPLLRSRIPFDVDSHGLGAAEGMETDTGLPGWRLFQGRRRSALRMRLLLHRCHRIYLSIPEQTAFLGGSLFRESTANDIRLASRLPEKVVYAPMGASERPFPDESSPYGFLGDRPVLLWGGGIWSWFDIPTLLRAFAHLSSRGHPAALYFLAGANPSGLSSQDSPFQRAKGMASQMGLLDSSVFFHPSSVSPEQLPRYLGACRAGILSNPPRLEALLSWRTRLLDLLWAGKPAVVSGSDPLTERMVSEGAALAVPAGDHEALADAIARLCDDADLVRTCGGAAQRMGKSLGWSSTLSQVVGFWSDPGSWSPSAPAPGRSILRVLAGL